ncbi:hypothetical protein [Candidatus Kryptobacter tengchongensis]|uniref:Uncharacterized protein n=1 Tax=Kryptobacter tengchongensis TaxID=1643429 RepID=A0A656D9V3_KRYT1|nr:hypothetical protein [Candidatus Kryptobacter tengchongensis]CUT02816.1 hypothetical protein JGI24_01194 [Candidatus Kryptobacter tengchongensis]
MSFYTDLIGTSPILTVSLAGLIVVILEALFKKSETISYIFSIISLIVAGFFSIYTYPMYSTAFNSMIAVEDMQVFLISFFVLGLCLQFYFQRIILLSEKQTMVSFIY